MFIRNGELVIISRIKLKIKFMKSLKFRIFLVILISGIIPSLIIMEGYIRTYKSESISSTISDIQSQAIILSNQLYNCSYLSDTSSEIMNGEISQLSNVLNGRIMIINDDYNIIKDTYVMDEEKTIISESVIKCFKGQSTAKFNEDGIYIEITAPVRGSEKGSIKGVILIYMSVSRIDLLAASLSEKVMLLEIACIIIMLLVAFCCSRVIIKPFDKISSSIDEMTAGFLDEDITFSGYTETEQIAEAFNKMLGKMRSLDESRQEFVSNVSHELKTPITSMKVLADSLLVQEDAPVELYKEFMTDIAKEIERENKIINDLLALVKLDKSSSDLNISPITINDLLELILKRLRPIAAKRNIELVFESFRPVTAEIDEVKLTLAFSNLVENAIKYNQDNGSVRVSLNADHQYFFVKVSDTGIGIPEESIDHIYERFYRVDKSHSRDIGGTGLGLSITRNAVLMHRGAIKVYSKENEGTTFTVRIPLIYVA